MTAASPPSLYRGYSRAGIGEGEGRGVAHGEQYLAADGALGADLALLDAARVWMTLDAKPTDHERLDGRLEGWSYFRAGRRHFVARLAAAGRYDTRHAYFTHARVWPADAFAGGQDPGVLIGVSDAFDEPWRTRDPQTAAVLEDAHLLPPAPTAAEQATLAALVAHLYQAAVQRTPVIMAAPLSDFVEGSALHRLVACARAALPLSLKRDLTLRIYTRSPELYVSDGGASLVVVPDDEAPHAMAACPGATLLDRTGVRRAGREPAASFACYADETVRRAIDRPSALLRFTERVERRPWSRTGTTDVSEIGFVYTVAAAAGSTADLDQFVRSLYKTLELSPDAPPRHELLTIDDLQRCSDAVLQELILKPRSTPHAVAMRSMVEDAAKKKGTPLEPHLTNWWSNAAADASERMTRTLELEWHPEIQAFLKTRSASELNAAFKRPALISTCMRLTDAGVLPTEWEDTWVPAAIELADAERLVELTRWMLAQPARRKRRELEIVSAMASLLDRDVPVTEGLAQYLTRLWPGPAAPSDIKGYVLLAELLYRADHALADPYLLRLAAVNGRDRRRQVVQALADVRLQLTAAFRIPVAWEADVADLLVAHEKQRALLEIDELVRLVANGRTFDASTRGKLFASIDDRMREQPEPTTAALIRRRCWLTWQLSTALEGAALRNCARHWVCSPVWRDGLEPYLEDWKAVVRLLDRSLNATDFIEYATNRPHINDCEEEQQRDWLSTAGDLVGLAWMATQHAALRPTALATIDGLVAACSPTQAMKITGGLLNWVGKEDARQPLPSELEEMLDQIVQRHPVVAEPSEANRQLAAKVARRGLTALSAALHPSLSEDNAFVIRIANALAKGKSNDTCWPEIAERPRRTLILNDVAHTLATIADEDHAPFLEALSRCGWPTLLRAADRPGTSLLTTGGFDGPRALPALRLAAVLDDGEALGVLAARLAATDAALMHATNALWWEGLFHGLTVPRRNGFRHATDRQESAVALLYLSRPVEASRAFDEALACMREGQGSQESTMSIADVVTPFSPSRSQSDRQVILEGRDGEMMILGARRLDFETFRKKKPDAGWTRETVAAVLEQRGGGMLVSLDREHQLTIDHVDPDRAASSGAKRAKQCALLSVGGVSMHKIDDLTAHALEPSSHVLLPADADAEVQLGKFLGYLDYLPTDRKLLVLNQIRRPSLDWRVDELERKLHGTPSLDGGRRRGGGLLDTIRATFNVARWRLKHWAVVGAVVAVLILGWLTRDRWLPGEPPGLAPVITSIEPPSVVAGGMAPRVTIEGKNFVPGSSVLVNDEPRPADFVTASRVTVRLQNTDIAAAGQIRFVVVTPDKRSTEPMELKIAAKTTPATIDGARRALLDVMAASNDARIQSLYRTHFQGANASPKTVALGFVKLQVLKDNKLPRDHESTLANIDRAKTRQIVTAAYQVAVTGGSTNPADDYKLVENLDTDARALLSLTICDGYNMAALPGPDNDPALMRFDRRDCATLANDPNVKAGALAAMNALVEWVRTQKTN